ncbi:hypothetical protein IBX73_09935 [candidate division WOR-3 bacterium]|nr:hypothetical protein [candidate division WOR-3 bacterium]
MYRTVNYNDANGGGLGNARFIEKPLYEAVVPDFSFRTIINYPEEDIKEET